MIPIDQTLFGDEGNCFNACLASILEISIEMIPHFKGVGWYCRYNEFLNRKFGLQLLSLQANEEVARNLFETDYQGINAYHIISGPGPRGFEHAVVGLNGVMVHDPHFHRSGLLQMKEFDFIMKSFT